MPQGCSTELNHFGYQFLQRMFEKHDKVSRAWQPSCLIPQMCLAAPMLLLIGAYLQLLCTQSHLLILLSLHSPSLGDWVWHPRPSSLAQGEHLRCMPVTSGYRGYFAPRCSLELNQTLWKCQLLQSMAALSNQHSLSRAQNSCALIILNLTGCSVGSR